MIRVAILTVSDSCALGKREDISGQAIEDMLSRDKFEICEKRIVPDDQDAIAGELMYFSDEAGFDLVFTTGGTGLGPRDVTPEATVSVCERIVPGLGEVMRVEGLKRTPNAILSRGMAGTRRNTLVINLPGSPSAVRECLELIVGILPHAVEMMRGGGH
ncbi:MAG: MogA/MoaB family molybdenum cofactor biosynthesis protein [Planctomycetota bacterium]|nr:MogA/MoaB family molybdenum cofactor biosynthesis protein [Planctomycetota bacterium]